MDELRESILVIFLSEKSIEKNNFFAFYDLCRKYYPKYTINEFYIDPLLSPLLRYLLLIRILFFKRNYNEAKKIFLKLSILCECLPWGIAFKYKNLYLWYYLLKTKQWCLFKMMLCLFNFKLVNKSFLEKF